MSIKQSIASLVILLSVSFNAFASDYLKITQIGNNSHVVTGCTGISVGSVVALGFRSLGNSYNGGTCTEIAVSASAVRVSWKYGSKTHDGYMYGSLVSSCPDGEQLNPDTGKCEEPPVPFCERPDTINQMNQFKDACFDKGWNPVVSCTDSTESLEMSCNPPPEPEECTPDSSDWPACKDPEPEECTPDSPDWDPRYGTCCRPENNWCDTPEPESCVIGGPNWPACATDTDIDPPTGGDLGDPDKPSGGGTGNPDPDKPEPDVDNTSDTLAAIKSMNSDLNAQLTGINNDMNKNQAETKSALDALKRRLI